MKRYLVSTLFILQLTLSGAQDEKAISLMSQLAEWVSKQDDEGAKWLKKDYGEWLLEGTWRSGQLDTLFTCTGALMSAKLPFANAGRGYLESTRYLMETGDSLHWRPWHELVFGMVDKRKWKKILPGFLEVSPALFSNGTIYDDGIIAWSMESVVPTFELDSFPIVRFSKGNLVGIGLGDRLTILQTEGFWNVEKEQFQGGAGRITWAGTSLDSTTHFADFPEFLLRLDGKGVTVDQALFHSTLVPEPLPGRLTAKLQQHADSSSKDYPKFETDASILEIRDVVPGIHYLGGISIRGSRLQGIGTAERGALLEVWHEDTVMFRVVGPSFLFTGSGISAEHCKAGMYYREDSIHHPDCSFRFDYHAERLSLNRMNEGLSMQPFSDSYHRMDLDVESIQWKRGATTVTLGGIPGAVNRTAVFTSSDYYKNEDFRAIQGVSDQHPLLLLKQFRNATGFERFSTLDFAEFIQLNELSTRMMLIELANQGFIEMDLERLMCSITSKADEYLLNATGRRDYDCIQLISMAPNGLNGALSMLNGRLRLDGIQPFLLSDSQAIKVFPESGQIEMGKNRSMAFRGKVEAGNLELNGQGFKFNYENNLLELSQVDEVQILVDDPNERNAFGTPIKHKVMSTIHDVSGALKIDDPGNRSGRRYREFPDYPILESRQTSFVYYDHPRIQGGAYARDQFHFAINPFVLNKLDRLTATDLTLDGTLVSAGILPDLDQPLVLMDDFSLGIQSITAVGGSPLYGGQATYTDAIQLDLNGLHGKGIIDFKTAHATSDDFTFLPEVAFGNTTVFRNRSDEALNVPFVNGQGGELHFEPYNARLVCKTILEPLTCYGSRVKYSGELALVDSGMYGNGQFSFFNAELNSPSFVLMQERTTSDSAGFELRGAGQRLNFVTATCKADVHFDAGWGAFEGLNGEMQVSFPVNYYQANFDRFHWMFEANQIALESDRQFPIESVQSVTPPLEANMLSLHPQQDSLTFLSPKTLFDVASSRLSCKQVKYLHIADAEIWPDSSQLVIEPMANMLPLERASLFANRISRYHRITDAHLEISGRNRYEGYGAYIYKDLNGTAFELAFQKVFVDDKGQTRAEGMVLATDDFTLSPAFSYAGKVFLDADNRFLRFEGGSKMIHYCSGFEPEWIAFNGRIDPKSVAIPIGSTPNSINRDQLTTGIVVSGRSPFTAYPTFLTELENDDDQPLIPSEGELRFNAKDKQYIVSSEEKFNDPSSVGTIHRLTKDGCKYSGSGELALPLNYGLMLEQFIGDAWLDEKGGMRIRGNLTLDFLFDDELLERIASQLPMWPNSSPLDVLNAGFDHFIRESMDAKEATEALDDLSLTGRFKRIPKALRHTMVLSGVEFLYDPREASFVSEGKIGISMLGNEQVYLEVAGKIELKRYRAGDELRLYLHGGEENWYYLEYRLGTMVVSTTDKVFEETLVNLKGKSRTIKEEGMRFGFQSLGQHKRKNDFVGRFTEFD